MTLALTEVDGFALAMLAILGLSFGVVLLIFTAIMRHGARREKEVERLLDDVEADEDPPEPATSGPPAEKEPWERDADWWRR